MDLPRPDEVAEVEDDTETIDTPETDTTTDDLPPLDTTTVDTKRTTTDDPLLPGMMTETDSPVAAPLVAVLDTEESEVATVVAGTMIGIESDTLLPEIIEDPHLETPETCESPGTPTEIEASEEETGTADLPHESGSSEVSTEPETTTDLKRCVDTPADPPTQKQTQIYESPPEAVPTEVHTTCKSDVRRLAIIRLLCCSIPSDSTLFALPALLFLR